MFWLRCPLSRSEPGLKLIFLWVPCICLDIQGECYNFFLDLMWFFKSSFPVHIFLSLLQEDFPVWAGNIWYGEAGFLRWKGLKSHFTLSDFEFSANKDFPRMLDSALISQFDRIQTVCWLFRCEKWPLSISSTSFSKLLLASAVNPSKQNKEK